MNSEEQSSQFAVVGSEQVAARLKHLEDLIESYAITTMPFEQFLALALGEERAARILKRNDAQAQAALLDQWHEWI